jgi:hypothetical protein
MANNLNFDQAHFPADFDSTYEYVDRHDKLVKKGNGLQAKIMDFSLQTFSRDWIPPLQYWVIQPGNI